MKSVSFISQTSRQFSHDRCKGHDNRLFTGPLPLGSTHTDKIPFHIGTPMYSNPMVFAGPLLAMFHHGTGLGVDKQQ